MSNNTPTLDRSETSYKYALLSIADRLSRSGIAVAPMAQARWITAGLGDRFDLRDPPDRRRADEDLARRC